MLAINNNFKLCIFLGEIISCILLCDSVFVILEITNLSFSK